MNVLRVGRYRVLEHLGAGRSAEIYLAEDTHLHRKVALKIFRRRHAESASFRKIKEEIGYAAMLSHPNILTLFDFGEEDGIHYLATEYVEGETVRQLMRGGALPVGRAVHIAIGVARALVAAHEMWVVHRDIKPENIMLRPDGGVKVLDFGVASSSGEWLEPLEGSGALVGSLHYLSPEQVRGELIIDTRSDLYSLGVVLYEMVTGEPPFTAPAPLEVLAAIVEQEAPPIDPSFPPALAAIIRRSLRKNIYERYQTAADMLNDLSELQLSLLMQARNPSTRSERDGGDLRTQG